MLIWRAALSDRKQSLAPVLASESVPSRLCLDGYRHLPKECNFNYSFRDYIRVVCNLYNSVLQYMPVIRTLSGIEKKVLISDMFLYPVFL